MRDELKLLCEKFINNRDAIKANIKWQSDYIYPVCSALYTSKNMIVDEYKLEECRGILKDNTGIFSNFRGYAELCIVCLIALSDNSEEKFKKTLEMYNSFKEEFMANSYLPIASVIVADNVEENRFKEISHRTREIYNLMKSEHPFLTSGEDSVFAAIFALSDKTNGEIVSEMEKCYGILRPEFFSANSVQALSHVLSLIDGNSSEKCKRVMKLFNSLKDRGYKYGTGYELQSIGVLAMLPVDENIIIEELIEVDEFLAKQKGYSGLFGLSKKQRLMHAGLILTGFYMDDNLIMESSAISTTISIIVAQQAAMMGAIAASTAAASAASSASN